MPRFKREHVRLLLAGRETLLATNYSVAASVFEVPSQFTLRVSQDTEAGKLAAQYPEWTPFELYVGDVKVQFGETDGYKLGTGDGTEIDLMGRDLLARLVDTQIESERTFSEQTFTDLTTTAMDEVGLGDVQLLAFGKATDFAITGTQTVRDTSVPTEEAAQTTEGAGEGGTKIVRNRIRAEVGTSWFQFLLDQYRKAGLFLFSTETGFLLKEPGKNLDPIFRIYNDGRGNTNVVGRPSFSRDGRKRYSECVVHGRYGAGKAGRNRTTGRFVDDEATALLGDRAKRLVIYDKKIATKEEAEFLARRRIAQSRREGWSLAYTVAGHVTKALDGSGLRPWKHDDVVEIADEEYGLFGNMFIQGVEYKGEPEQTTVIKLMRLEDMFFAEQIPSTGMSKNVGKGLQPRRGINHGRRSDSGRLVLLEDND